MAEAVTIGLDIAKQVFQVHGVEAKGTVVVRWKLRRSEVCAFFERLPSCLIGLEACATGHHWARVLSSLGHDARLMPAAYLGLYVKRQKNDAADAKAICEAVTRPTMRFVPVKREEQQGILMIHRSRELLMGRITKQGDPYIRRLLVVGAHAVLRYAHKSTTAPSQWAAKLLARQPCELAAVVMANKLARIAWALMVTGEPFKRTPA